MVAYVLPPPTSFWRAVVSTTTRCIIVLTVWILVAGNTATNAQETDAVTKYLFTAYTRACRLIMKSYAGGEISYDETKKLKVMLYGSTDSQAFPITEAIEQINQTSLFTNRNMTVITIHGFNDHAVSDTSLNIAKAYNGNGNYNVILVDSSELTSGNYMKAVYTTELIGRKLAYFIYKTQLNPNKIHIIGISLGAQIAGWLGRFYKSLSGKKIHHITGIDPAGPCFTFANETERLSQNDAEFVDVIHVNRGVQGVYESIGHTDFFVNGGGPNQPGCEDTHCSHHRGVVYFLESFNSLKPFLARKCTSWKRFEDNLCKNNEVITMGFDATFKSKGNFYLRTASVEPFSLGENGASPLRVKRNPKDRTSYFNYFGRK